METEYKNVWRTIGLVLIGIIIGYIIGRFSYIEYLPKSPYIQKNTQINKQEKKQKPIQQINLDDDPFIGSDSAALTIVTFSDYQCPFCRNFYINILPELKKNYINTGKIKYVYRDYPLKIHKFAINAAMAANCSGEQGKYWEMHDKLYENQEKWNKVKNANDIFKQYSVELGLNTYMFNECLDSEKYRDEVINDKNEAKEYGVLSTPTLFLNGQMLRGGYFQSYELFEKYIEREFNL
jgi:protein-disulfide isomerase